MAEFATQISDLTLYQELDQAAGRDAIGKTDVDVLKALVNHVADTAGPAMAQIPVTFRQYTVHDIRHCRNVIARMGDILPVETREKLNALEITFLLLAALLHDVGMVVSDHEKAETLRSESFRRFRAEGHSDRNKAIEEARAGDNEPRARAIEDALLAEYYRRLHPERVRLFMRNQLAGRLQYREIDFADDLARLCESHSWGVEESSHPEKAVARLDDNVRLYGVRVNLQYLACILRLADILDFDRSRTPLAVFQHLDFSEPKSWEEWNKHLQVKGYEITTTQVAFDIPCTHPVFYVAVHEFLGWIDEELRQCRYLAENKPQPTADRYKLLLPHVVDRHKVRMADPSYVAGAFRFQLEYENILALLMDKSLYPDPSLFLRELLQNALDACRRKEADMQVKGLAYTPRLVVWDRTDDPNDPRVIFQDNGIGMSQRIVEQYFLRVGRSYYRSPEFDAERQRLQEHGKELDACSMFGIGILSCFLVGDRFEVETHQEGYDPLHIEIEGPSKYFVMRRLPRPEPHVLYQKAASDEEDGPPKRTGTRVTVHLRPGVGVDVWGTLDTFAVNVDYAIRVHLLGRNKPRIIQALRWEKPVRVQDCWFRLSSDLVKGSALADLLIPSFIPLSRENLTHKFRGRAWFWLLRKPDGQPTPRSGFLEVGRELRLIGIPLLLARLEADSRLSNTRLCYGDWLRRKRHSDFGISNADAVRLFEVAAKRLGIHEESLQHWAEQRSVIKSFLTGSMEWADQPISLEAPIEGVYDSITVQSGQIALHSILIPAGIVEWSPIKVISREVSILPFFGGIHIDLRGQHAPRPAAHRLFIPGEGAEGFKQSLLHAALLHGMDLVAQYGRTLEWRIWFGELAECAIDQGLDTASFCQLFGQQVEDTCGLAAYVDGEINYFSRAELCRIFSGPIYLSNRGRQSPRLLWEDGVNQLLSSIDWLDYGDSVEVDLSCLPILRRSKNSPS